MMMRRVLFACTISAIGASLLMPAPAHAAAGPVVISELNYHAYTDVSTDDFIELANAGDQPIDISGWSFTAGIGGVLPAGSVIPAGGRFVGSPDATAFQTLYGFAPDFVYTGNLSNSGEQVTLVDGALAEVDSVTYADSGEWPPAPDGPDTLPRSFGSAHAAGCYFAMADGAVRLIAYDIDPEIHRRHGHRADGL